jgi:catechol 2,3-dioxygenase-like lactoylglutathione lyase family enzyme
MRDVSRVHFILYVREQEASRAFFESVLNCPPTLHVPGMTEFTIADSTILGLMPDRGIARLLSLDPEAVSRRSIRGEIYLLVSSPESFHHRALVAGAKELSPLGPRNWGDQVAYSLDPNGYILAFASPIGAEPG